MAINTAHSGAGIILFGGENIIMTQDNVELSFEKAPAVEHFKGTKKGRVFLTSQRLIFRTDGNNILQSFSMPFFYMKEVDIKQPTFGPNNLQGRILAQPGGDWEGDARFKLNFKSGGAVNLGQTLIKVATKAPQVPPPHPKAQGPVPTPASHPAAYPQPLPPQGGYPQQGAYAPQGYPMQGYPQQYTPYPPTHAAGYPPQPAGYPPQQAYSNPYYAAGPTAPPSEQPPPYMAVDQQQSDNAYYNPQNPGYVYMPQNPATVPTAPPPPAYSEKSKLE